MTSFTKSATKWEKVTHNMCSVKAQIGPSIHSPIRVFDDHLMKPWIHFYIQNIQQKLSSNCVNCVHISEGTFSQSAIQS